MHRHQTSLDRLETRALFAATAVGDGRTLTITGTPDNDQVEFIQNQSFNTLRVRVTTRLIVDSSATSATYDFDDQNVLRIVMDLGAGNDSNNIYPTTSGPRNRRMTLLGGAGDDFLTGGPNADFIDAGDGNDTVDAYYGNDTIFGGSGSDHIDAGNGDDRVEGGASRDYIFGGQGNDRLYGGSGNDILHGDQGWDHLSGDAGDDYLLGGMQRDVLYGGAGNDRLEGEGSDNYLNGGDGIDTGKTRNRRIIGGIVEIESVL